MIGSCFVVAMEIKILYDNAALKGFKKGWGFSCLIELDKTKILFDTGDGPGYLTNLKSFGIDPQEIQHVILSHPHIDHVGGLKYLIQVNSQIIVHTPTFFPLQFKMDLMTSCNMHETFGFEQIFENIYVDFARNYVSEQFCIIDLSHGLLIITGCAHPGLDLILRRAARHEKPLYGVLGGFHNFNKLDKLENLSFIAPCHCTTQKSSIIQSFPDKAKPCASGMVFKF
ncbi:MAG: MBL fold metallo-hydrolase [Candidatus Helarchaeota archaeon]